MQECFLVSDRQPYKSDLSDERWALIEPVIASWKAQTLPRSSGVAVTLVVHEHKRLGRGIELALLAEDLKASDVGLEFLTGELKGSHDPSGIVLRGRFRPMFHPVIGCFTVFVGSRQEIVFSPVRRRAMRSVMAMWITASERLGRVS